MTFVVLLHQGLTISSPGDIARDEIDGQIYFFGSTAQSFGDEIWRSDGTPQGTILAFNGFDQFACPGFDGIMWLPMINGRLGILGVDGCGEAQIWAFDERTVELVASLGQRTLQGGEFIPNRGKFLLTLQGRTLTGGSFDDMWFTDYTTKGTQKILSFQNNIPCCVGNGDVQQTTLLTRGNSRGNMNGEDIVLFRGSDENGFELWEMKWTTYHRQETGFGVGSYANMEASILTEEQQPRSNGISAKSTYGFVSLLALLWASFAFMV